MTLTILNSPYQQRLRLSGFLAQQGIAGSFKMKAALFIMFQKDAQSLNTETRLEERKDDTRSELR